MEKTLGDYLKQKEITENPSLLNGKIFSNVNSCQESEDQCTYILYKVWKDNEGKFLANLNEVNFGMMGLSNNYNSWVLNNKESWIELIEGVNAEKVCPLVFGTSSI